MAHGKLYVFILLLVQCITNGFAETSTLSALGNSKRTSILILPILNFSHSFDRKDCPAINRHYALFEIVRIHNVFSIVPIISNDTSEE